MIVDCAHYVDGARQHGDSLTIEQAAVMRCLGGFTWVGLFEPDAAELARVRDSFGLHELAIEDAQSFHLRPKAETYEGGGQLVIFRTARYDDEREEIDFGEISVFVGGDFVITVRQGVASELAGARSRLERRPELLRAGSTAVLWAILDQVVDGYAPVVAEVERDLEQVEATVFAGAAAPTQRIYFLRREVTNFYRAVHPLLSVLHTVQQGASHDMVPYFRDIQDNLALVNEEVAAQRDLLSTVLQANMAVLSVEQTQVSVRQNATMQRLTVLSTIFLPLTFVTGFFGQNFAWLVDNIADPWEFLVFGVGGLLVPIVLLGLWLRRTARSEPGPDHGTAADSPAGPGNTGGPATARAR